MKNRTNRNVRESVVSVSRTIIGRDWRAYSFYSRNELPVRRVTSPRARGALGGRVDAEDIVLQRWRARVLLEITKRRRGNDNNKKRFELLTFN